MKWLLLLISLHFYLFSVVSCSQFHINVDSQVHVGKNVTIQWNFETPQNQNGNHHGDSNGHGNNQTVNMFYVHKGSKTPHHVQTIGPHEKQGHFSMIFHKLGGHTITAVQGNTTLTYQEFNVTDISNMSKEQSTPAPDVSLARHRDKIAAIVGGVIGGLVGLSLLVFLFIFLRRRRETIRKRLTFDRDLMVQHRVPRAPSSTWIPGSSIFGSKRESNRGSHASRASGNRTVPIDAISTRGTDVRDPGVESEFGAGSMGADTGYVFTHPKAALGTGHIVPSPKGPRPSVKQTNSTPEQSLLQKVSPYPYPSQPPTQPVSHAPQHVLEWVQTQAQPLIEFPSRSELVPPPPTQFITQQR